MPLVEANPDDGDFSPKTEGPRESVIFVVLGYFGPFFVPGTPAKRWWEMKPAGEN